MKTLSHTRYRWGLLILLVLLASCAPLPTPGPTPTPTRTPFPTATPTPSPTPTPLPTPTPAFPVTVSCAAGVPASACAILKARVEATPAYFRWINAAEVAEVLLQTGADPGAYQQGQWTFAVAAPFFTLDEGTTLADLQATWQGTPAGLWTAHPLLLTEDAADALRGLLGAPAANVYTLVAPDALLTEVESRNAWTIMPFDELNPRWKVLRLDGISLLEKTSGAATYPLMIPLMLDSSTRRETLELLDLPAKALVNRDEEAMTLVVMTGVTAMTRGTSRLMENKGVTYIAEDVQDWLVNADITHISNELSYLSNHTPEPGGTMSLASHDKYIEALEFVGADVIELTGNHLVDRGIEPLRRTLQMYRDRGWKWFGGGENYTDARQPALFENGPNKIAFIGCNSVDNPYDWATDELPGVFSCRQTDRKALDPEDLAYLEITIADLRSQGYNVIFTVQEYETESYTPFAGQVSDFRTFADLGPVYVQGSQAHQPQTMEFYGNTFIHYGLGNLFFDQMWNEGRQGFVNRLVFYNNRLLSIELLPTWIEEYGRPRPMIDGDPIPAADRRQFLEMIFALRP